MAEIVCKLIGHGILRRRKFLLFQWRERCERCGERILIG